MIQSVLELLCFRVGVLSVSFVLEAKSLIRLNEYFIESKIHCIQNVKFTHNM